MSNTQQNIKRFIDIILSAIAIIILIPAYIFLAIGVKLSSKGDVFYTQKRIGKSGKEFDIYKFRSMYENAEPNGPTLSHLNDKRITTFGKFMRKTSLDEIPQFINVLKGDMSIVGPRPERQFYISQITKLNPEYLSLLQIRPGITGLGQVKFGYAKNVEDMIKRLRFDLFYLKHMSLFLDFKILLYTIKTIIRGK